MARRALSAEECRSYAISKARDRRRVELTPLREEIDNAITRIGWRRARPIVEQVMGFPISRQRGAWWSKVGKRNGQKLLVALAKPQRRSRQDRPASSMMDRRRARLLTSLLPSNCKLSTRKRIAVDTPTAGKRRTDAFVTVDGRD
jgi:hypothetical protein